MSKTVFRIPQDVLTVLRQTANRMDGVELDEMIGAALWAFAREDALTRNMVVEDYWSQGFSASAFRAPALPFRRQSVNSPTVCGPHAEDALPPRSLARKYSKAQIAMAAQDWFAGLPEEVRIELVYRYLVMLTTSDGAPPQPSPAPWLE